MTKKRIATVWLDGCSGCHMSFLDMDERLLAIAGAADLVYSPLVDAKEFPENVDVTLVEGAVSSEEDLEKIKGSASARRFWSRSAIARSRPMSPECAIHSEPRPCTTALIGKT